MTKRLGVFLSAVIGVFVGLSLTSAQDSSLTFDVATIKPSPPPNPGGPIRVGVVPVATPGRVTYRSSTLKAYLLVAFGLREAQFVGPSWLSDERFDIEATMPVGTAAEQTRMMLRNLLIERFRIRSHRETKQTATYTLSVNKGGPRIKESMESAAPDPNEPATPPVKGPDGYMIAPRRPGVFIEGRRDRTRLTCQQCPMSQLAGILGTTLGGVGGEDATGLTGKYDLTLTFSHDGLPPQPALAPPIGTSLDGGVQGIVNSTDEVPPILLKAVEEQLGLKLERKDSTVEILVVDSIERKPIDN